MFISNLTMGIACSDSDTNTDLVNYGLEESFEGVKELYTVVNVDDSIEYRRASAVKSALSDKLNFDIFATSAHNLLNKISIKIDGVEALDSFVDPRGTLYSSSISPMYDIGFIILPKSSLKGYSIYSGDPNGLLNKTLIHSAFGFMSRDGYRDYIFLRYLQESYKFIFEQTLLRQAALTKLDIFEYKTNLISHSRKNPEFNNRPFG